MASWTLALLRLLGAVQWSWTWTPVRAPYSQAHSYLNAAQRPLWILEDELMKHHRVDRSEADYDTTTHETTSRRMRQDRELQPPPIRIVVRPDAPPPPPPPPPPLMVPYYQRPHRLQIPSHYVQQRRQSPSMLRRQPRTEQRSRQPQSLPIFDNAPGDNTLSATSYPIFVYNGTKGELLVNTMLSAQRYPMQEPVPGQILYPPSTPMFRPKPIVERFRLPGQRELLNLTLIPFYAHEAITSAPITTTPTMLIDSSTTPMPRPYETQMPPSKRRRNPKKAKQYNAYRSPQEVMQRQPVLRASPALAAPNNHRHHLAADTEFFGSPAEGLEQALLEELEELGSEVKEPIEQIELEEQQQLEETTSVGGGGSSSSSSSLQIVYMDDSLESPTDTLASTTAVPHPQRQSSRYSMKREYFAFPVYTLGKLLQDQKSDKIRMGHIVKMNDSTEHGDTWFILNSRYKGPHRNGQKSSQNKYFTSKYVQNSKGTSS
ncbi:uncharacterized protein LOC117787657 [Drosophila innubila]|uniref:uncharacterized protein LOC117787657 n=1 Tax=Drosophila innubila TaxID=198719 RepID=UPI00148C48CF|nr:uncharacterized protein LOC117787657 [Drosophila innubila]